GGCDEHRAHACCSTVFGRFILSHIMAAKAGDLANGLFPGGSQNGDGVVGNHVVGDKFWRSFCDWHQSRCLFYRVCCDWLRLGNLCWLPGVGALCGKKNTTRRFRHCPRFLGKSVCKQTSSPSCSYLVNCRLDGDIGRAGGGRSVLADYCRIKLPPVLR